MKIVILGLSITSSWGNGHATTYRGLAREWVALGHYLSFTGGRTLKRIEHQYGSPMAARALYCSVDPSLYYPENCEVRFNVGYMGTYSDDRQPSVDLLILEPTRQWKYGCAVVAGPPYPNSIERPSNVERIEHLAPDNHREFYNYQQFTLNITRADMIRAGYSPSVRLFEAAACGTPIISDYWEGLDSIFEIGKEIFVAGSAEDVLRYLRETPEPERKAIATLAPARVLAEHTASHRAAQLEEYVFEVLKWRSQKS